VALSWPSGDAVRRPAAAASNNGAKTRKAVSLEQNLMTEAAANQLVAARLARRPGARLAESCRPRVNETALAIQRRVGELLHFDVGGWKCSLPTTDKAAFMAPIFAPTITSASPCSVLSEGANARVEPEIAFVLGRDLKRRAQPYSDSDVRSAIRETKLVLELIGCRYADPTSVSFLEMLADGLNNQGLFVGPEVGDGAIRPLETIRVTVASGTETILTHEGRHGDGHPLRPLVWLANFLASRDQGLEAGQIVTTGSYAGVLELPLATPLDIRFGDLGTLSVQFIGMV
jgi:2-keto-4-pentenoate hydratase